MGNQFTHSLMLGACALATGLLALQHAGLAQPRAATRDATQVSGQDLATAERHAGVPEINPAQLTRVPVVCRQKGPTIMEGPTCKGNGSQSGFMDLVEKSTRSFVAHHSDDVYRGKGTNTLTGAAPMTGLPVCNINQGEGVGSRQVNYLNESCGKFCKLEFDIDGRWGWPPVDIEVKPSEAGGGCTKEYGWYRGLYVQVLNYYKEKVFSEFRGGMVELVDVEGTRPCASAAAGVLRTHQAANQALADLIARHSQTNNPNDPAAMEKIAAIRCPVPGAGAPAPASSANNPQQGACLMGQTNLHLQEMWANFLGCEIKWRTLNEMETQFGNQDVWVNEISNSIAPVCERRGWRAAPSYSRIKRKVSECYEEQIERFLKEKTLRYKTQGPLERADNRETPAELLFALGSLIPAGLRRKKFSARRSKSVVAMLLAMVALIGSSGCGCDDNDMDIGGEQCTPCETGGGCLYSSCLSGLFLCFKGEVTAANVVVGNGLEGEIGEGAMCLRAKNMDALLSMAGITKDVNGTPKRDKLIQEMNAALVGRTVESGTAEDGSTSYTTETYEDEVAARWQLTITAFKDAKPVCEKVKVSDFSALQHPFEKDFLDRVRYNDSVRQVVMANAMGCPHTDLGSDPGRSNPQLEVSAIAAIADFRALMGLPATTVRNPNRGNIGGGAATVEEDPGFESPGAAGGEGQGGLAGLPPIGAVAGRGSGSSRSGGTGSSDLKFLGGKGNAGAAGTGSLIAAKAQAETAPVAYDSAKTAGAKAAKVGDSGLGDLFGNAGAGGPGGTGAGAVAFGGKTGVTADGDVEGYLQRTSSMSLFEIINARMDQWGRENID